MDAIDKSHNMVQQTKSLTYLMQMLDIILPYIEGIDLNLNAFSFYNTNYLYAGQ